MKHMDMVSSYPLHHVDIYIYPMLGVDSRFWSANNLDVHKEKGTSLMMSQWRSRPPTTFIVAVMRPSNTVFIKLFRPGKRDRWGFKAAETFLNVTNIVWVWNKFVTTSLLPRIREFIHTKHRNTKRGLRSRVVLRCCVWISSRICVSKQGVTNNTSPSNTYFGH